MRRPIGELKIEHTWTVSAGELPMDEARAVLNLSADLLAEAWEKSPLLRMYSRLRCRVRVGRLPWTAVPRVRLRRLSLWDRLRLAWSAMIEG